MSGRLPSPLLAKLVRGRPGLLAEEPREMRRIGESKFLGDVMDRLRRKNQLTFGLAQKLLPYQMAGGDTGGPLDVIVEAIDRHAELFGIKSQQPLVAKKLIEQTAQLRHCRVRRAQRNTAAARAACGKARHRNSDQDQNAAHRQAIAFAPEAIFVE